MNRLSLLRKLRALADDPAAAPNEREVARAKADALTLKAPARSQLEWWDEEFTWAEWDSLPEPQWHAHMGDIWIDLGPYNATNLHRALYINPDGTMRCKCHRPVSLHLGNGEVTVQYTVIGDGLA